MTPEDTDKIIAAIDRNTEVQKGVRSRLGWVLYVLVLLWFYAFAAGCPKAKAAPLLTAAPEPPALQYWHTVDIPTDSGVYQLEVYAPALPTLFAQPQIVEIGTPPEPPVHVPEPETWVMVVIPLGLIGALIGWGTIKHLEICKRLLYLIAVAKVAFSDIESSCEKCRGMAEAARKALEEQE